MSRRRKIHVATGSNSQDLLRYCVRHQGVSEGDVVFHLAQCLSFLIQGTDAVALDRNAKVPKNKFAIRKLKSALKMLDEVFGTSKE